jgi:hypothetical protein
MADVIVINEDLVRALRERETFLKSHPELRPLQRKIDVSLKKAKTQHNRLVVINNLMMEAAFKLTAKLRDLRLALR